MFFIIYKILFDYFLFLIIIKKTFFFFCYGPFKGLENKKVKICPNALCLYKAIFCNDFTDITHCSILCFNFEGHKHNRKCYF